MISKVGEKIKLLRKAQNLTQSELAGSELTKSMLSQIENNISNPSFKTLQYLAERLNKPISYLLEDDSDADSKLPLLSLPKKSGVTEEVNLLIDANKLDEAQKLLSDNFSDGFMNLGSSKETGDLLFKLGTRLAKSNNIKEGRDLLNLSIKSYSEADFNLEAAKACVELAFSYYQEFKYQECFSLSEKAFELYNRGINKDPLFEIELYYYKILILFAIGDIKKASDAINESIQLSARTSLYFKTGELYRLNAIFNFLINSPDQYQKCIEKSRQFAEFAEDSVCLGKICSVEAFYALEQHDWEKALDFAGKMKNYLGRESYIYYLILGRAFYIAGKYQQAYENIIRVDFPSSETHKFDYLNMWTSKVYEGMILNKLGNQNKAVEAVKLGIEKMLLFKESKFLMNAYKTLSDIYSEANDFKNAFIHLKLANELQEKINNDSNIIF